jgi:hypothetical protein
MFILGNFTNLFQENRRLQAIPITTILNRGEPFRRLANYERGGSLGAFFQRTDRFDALAKTAGSEIAFRQFQDPGIGEHRAVLAHVAAADTAPAALAYPAAHFPFQRGVDCLRGKAEIQKRLHGEFQHDRRSAYDAHGVVRSGCDLLENERHQADAAVPGCVALIDGNVGFHVTAILPLLEFGLIEQFARVS